MVRSLLSQCAREVIRDQRLFSARLRRIPYDLYGPLLDAAFTLCHPLVIIKLIERWPEQTLVVGHRRSHHHGSQQRKCESALLRAVLRGLSDKRCRLRVLDLCGLRCEEDFRIENPMREWSLTVALCTMLWHARNMTSPLRECRQDNQSKRKRDGGVKRDRAGVMKEAVGEMDCSGDAVSEQDNTNVVRRNVTLQRRRGTEPEQVDGREGVVVNIIANLFVNFRSCGQIRRGMRCSGPVRLYCRFLHVESMPVSSIVSLLHLIPKEELLGLDLCNSCIQVSELVLLLPHLARFPQLALLQLCYCKMDRLHSHPGQEEMLQDLSRGFGGLKSLRRLSLTGLHLPGFLHLVLSSLSEPLEALALPDYSLTSDDMAYLSHSPQTSSITKLDLTENGLDESSLRSLCDLLAQAKGSLMHLSLCDCRLSDGSLGILLPSLVQCHALRSLRLALNPLSRAALVGLVQAAVGIHSLKFLLYPKPLEEFQPGLPAMPSRSQLLNWPLIDDSRAMEATVMQLDEVLRANGRAKDLVLTFDLLKYNTNMETDD